MSPDASPPVATPDRTPAPSLARESWRLAASRAAHPSARLVDENVLAAIARGLAAVTVPAGLRSEPALPMERLLDTSAYDAWVRDFSPGARTAVVRLAAESALAVVAGMLEVELHSGETTTVRRVTAGDVVSVPAGWRFRLGSPDGAVTAIHVASPPLGLELRRTA